MKNDEDLIKINKYKLCNRIIILFLIRLNF